MQKLFLLFFSLIILFWIEKPVQAQVSPEEFDALMDLYDKTEGDKWYNSYGWGNENIDVENWHGVDVENGSVVALNLRNNNLVGTIHKTIGDLEHLKDLFLGNSGDVALPQNTISGELPNEISDLSNLERLDLARNEIEGSIPENIGDLEQLQEMDLSRNNFDGLIPESVNQLESLTNLSAGKNNLSGPIPSEIGNLENLKELLLDNNDLTENIPPEIGELTSLKILNLSNNQLSGHIPEVFTFVTMLEQLRLNANSFEGPIPKSIANLTNLTTLRLDFNELEGTLPEMIGDLTSLETLRLNNNNFSDEIPSGIGSLSTITLLHLSHNQLTGAIPDSISHLENLEELSVRFNKFDFLPELHDNVSVLKADNNHLHFDAIETNLSVDDFTYDPQAKVGEEKSFSLSYGESLTLQITVGGSHNIYQWYKDDDEIPDASSSTYTIDEFTEADAGVYICKIDHEYAGDLTLTSENQTVIYAGPVEPQVITKAVTDVTDNSAISGGNVIDEGGTDIEERGVVWDVTEDPDIDDNDGFTTDGSGTGEYSSSLTGLEPETTYYVRAYAKNEAGIAYGENENFTTRPAPPTVATAEPTDITTSSAILGGEVTNEGGRPVTDRGLYWGTDPDPENNGANISLGSGPESFSEPLEGLDSATDYFFVAYAESDAGKSFGNVKNFTTKEDAIKFPNAFMPDSDIPANQVFKPHFPHDPDTYTLEIYNRWGSRIFHSDNWNNGWDGTVNNQDAPQGNYIYHVSYTDQTGKIREKTGVVSLIR